MKAATRSCPPGRQTPNNSSRQSQRLQMMIAHYASAGNHELLPAKGETIALGKRVISLDLKLRRWEADVRQAKLSSAYSR